jgi:exo-1,4-beta-D-glucosaminidase
MSDLNNMPAARVGVSGTCESANGESRVDIKLTNNSGHIAFFLRAEVTKENGEEILPIRYDDNYVTIFPHESRTIAARYDSLAGFKPSLRLQGYNLPQDLTAPISCGGAAP